MTREQEAAAEKKAEEDALAALVAAVAKREGKVIALEAAVETLELMSEKMKMDMDAWVKLSKATAAEQEKIMWTCSSTSDKIQLKIISASADCIDNRIGRYKIYNSILAKQRVESLLLEKYTADSKLKKQADQRAGRFDSGGPNNKRRRQDNGAGRSNSVNGAGNSNRAGSGNSAGSGSRICNNRSRSPRRRSYSSGDQHYTFASNRPQLTTT